ncbi:hypothetical protein BACINT_03186 [Bacteroides intestinalis DSM 17393]|uniref:Uncharacterized protein n=1 Tax=Bacteroides intestinalis DSM 17393 TaxID=471870 RepID=B3CIK2_9BACE|nr:hypothetical protein BACINT_03186 [Bacteroides intestinalis DSM 17393]
MFSSIESNTNESYKEDEIVRFNNLNGYRNVPDSTKILLPLLKNN